jgi:hypothetical protein
MGKRERRKRNRTYVTASHSDGVNRLQPSPKQLNDFQAFHIGLGTLGEERMFFATTTNGGMTLRTKPYRRPMPKLIKGKQAIRAAKRAKVYESNS